MKKQFLNEVKQFQKIAGILKESEGADQNKVKEAFEKVIQIHNVHAKYFDYDLDELQNMANQHGFQNYDGGITGYDGFDSVDTGKDYQWAIARGDDFPHAVVIKNKEMLKDPKLVSFLKDLRSSNDF
jgi:hypothetical protein